MISDQPENPRIRTKIHTMNPAMDAAFFELIMQLKKGKIGIEQFQAETLAYFDGQIKAGKLDHYGAKTSPHRQSEWLLKRHIDECRYSVLCYYVAEGETHPPHHHHNVASTQIVMSGKLHLREYDRVERTAEGQLLLRLASDRMIGPGDYFQASEWSRNVHWFTAIDGPAVIFNTNARGFEEQTFDTEQERFGRLYVDPRTTGNDGLIRAEEFDEAEAGKRFQRG